MIDGLQFRCATAEKNYSKAIFKSANVGPQATGLGRIVGISKRDTTREQRHCVRSTRHMLTCEVRRHLASSIARAIGGPSRSAIHTTPVNGAISTEHFVINLSGEGEGAFEALGATQS
jgi:hypothetical protein